MNDKEAQQIHARPDAWPAHPAIECGYTDPDGRRWIHVPWAGWQPAGPHLVVPRRRVARWWWSR